MRRLGLLLTAFLIPSLSLAPAAAETDPVGQWPLRPSQEVVRDFAPPSSPWGAGHRGVDLAGRPGQPVHPALPGTVSFVGSIAGRGVVTVDHGTTRTTYEPVRASVKKGEEMDAGEVVGTVEATGSHCGVTCVHWGLRRVDAYLDPLSLLPPWLLRRGPSRLLPVLGVPLPP